MNLEAIALQWLRYDRRCMMVAMERSPWGQTQWYRPDVVGVTFKRTVIEVEIKRSVADFRANANKRGMKFELYFCEQRYFLVEPAIVQACLTMLPLKCGLLVPDLMTRDPFIGLPQVKVLVKASRHPTPSVLTVLQLARMVQHQSATLVRYVAKNGGQHAKANRNDTEAIGQGS